MVTPRRASPRRPRGPRQGYNLVILMVLVTIMSVLIAIALPAWSQVIKRQKEQELIFRGLQYAEAIRVFQLRQGRFPTSLKELLETEPRSIRQLWTDPFRDDGTWGLVLAQTQRGQQVGRDEAQGSAPQRSGIGDDEDVDGEDELEDVVPTEDVSRERDFGAPRGVQATGPLIGVRSITKEESSIKFMGSNSIDDWEFTADLIALLPNGASLDMVPRLTTEYIGRAFPEGLEPQQGGMPGGSSGIPGGTGNQSGSQPGTRPQTPSSNTPRSGIPSGSQPRSGIPSGRDDG